MNNRIILFVSSVINKLILWVYIRSPWMDQKTNVLEMGKFFVIIKQWAINISDEAKVGIMLVNIYTRFINSMHKIKKYYHWNPFWGHRRNYPTNKLLKKVKLRHQSVIRISDHIYIYWWFISISKTYIQTSKVIHSFIYNWNTFSSINLFLKLIAV